MFLFGGNTGQTQDTLLEQRRRLAQALMQQGMDNTPIRSAWQGAARMANAFMGGLDMREMAMDQSNADAAAMAALGGQDYVAPAPAGFTDALGAMFGGSGSSSGQSAPQHPGVLSRLFGGGSDDQPQAAHAPTTPVAQPSQQASVPSDVHDLIAQNVPPEMQGYATNLIGKESNFNPNAVSPTGATGLAQFTRGTGKDYGLDGPGFDNRKDPAANLKALVALTNDNRAGLQKALGREPTDGELALAHQQGLGGAINLLSGKGVPANNLAVNGVAPGTDPHAAAQQIMSFYGGSGGPTQVASLDPAAGMSQGAPTPSAAPGSNLVAALNAQSPDPTATGSVGGQQSAAPPLSPPVNVAANPVPPQAPAAPQPDPQVAQAQSPADRLTSAANGQPSFGYQNPMASPRAQALIRAMSNPNMSPGVREMLGAQLQQEVGNANAINNALIEQRIKQADPQYQLGLQKGQIELDHLQHPENVTPESVRALNLRAQQAGLVPGTPAYIQFMLSGGNVQRNEAPPPAGYRNVRDDQGNLVSIEPIPGGPQAAAQQIKQDAKDISTNVVTTAAQHAREAAMDPTGTLPATGSGSGLASVFSGTNAAEVRRQIDVMKANASLDNLSAMRAASPTGGALGSVTEGEEKLLANKIGIIDPSSPHFLRDLDAAEKTQLEIIHGKEAGDQFWLQGNGQRYPKAPKIGTVEQGHRYTGGNPAEPDSWEQVK